MLYPQNQNKELDCALFHNPTSEYRGAPFWAWNCKLDKDTILEQIEIMKKMGMGGYHVHVRTGMATEYMSDEFMNFVRTALEKGKKEKMLTWLYDEDRWPSGAAGGLVTKGHPEFRVRYLVFTPDKFDHAANKSGGGIGSVTFIQENAEFIAAYDIRLNTDGTLAAYSRIGKQESADGDKWYAYLVEGSPSGWFNDQTYIDTMNPAAINEFIRTTHEPYAAHFKEDFGGAVPAIFTDEPQIARKSTLGFAHEKKDVFIPWTPDFVDSFKASCGLDIMEGLPELIWNLPDNKASVIRYHYHDHSTERFASAFCDILGSWCGKNGLSLTGHLMHEETLESQTGALGEAMRCYRSFQLPGIDMLCNKHEYNTAKQCQSVARQQGAEGIMSELYGVTGWDFDFRGHKLHGDWQAAMGVTIRVPHLTWMSMRGEAKRDYPACIGYQSPWYDQYTLVEDHFARVNTAMTRGKPIVNVAVIHPIESYWLHWGPSEQTKAIREQLEDNYSKLTETLLFGMIDFDFVSESLLPSLCAAGSNPLKIGEMAYDVVIIPGLHVMRSTTLERVAAFQKAGGRLIFLGECPALVDAVESDAIRSVYEAAEHCNFDAASILSTLEPQRILDVRLENGARTDNIIHQLRHDGNDLWLFAAVGKDPSNHDVDEGAQWFRFTIKGEYKPVLYDTLTGEIGESSIPMAVEYHNGCTIINRWWNMHDSMLLKLLAGDRAISEPCGITSTVPESKPLTFFDKMPVTLQEPNALLLDMAEFALDGEQYSPREELLRAENICRERLGIPLRKKHVTQPYLIEDKPVSHSISLRFTIRSEVDVSNPQLAGEDMQDMKIRLNGQPASPDIVGWYVDKAIETIKLPPIKKGDNILEIKSPIGGRTNLEWFYLLGDFGVRVDGSIATIIPPVRTLAFDSYVHQGLPFYTGNLTYHLDVEIQGKAKLRIPVYRGALIRIAVDGEDKGTIVYSPYILNLSELKPGKHRIDITLYGTRQNGFAQLHHSPSVFFYQSPDSWRSTGDLWLYEYQLKPAGIMKSPEIYIETDTYQGRNI